MKIPNFFGFLILLLASCTPTVTPITVPANFPTPTSTLAPTAPLTITPSLTVYPTQVFGLLISPDGTKRVQSPDWNNYQVLTTEGEILWSISYENKLGAFEPSWHPFYWSQDGQYIYFTCYHGPDDGSTKFIGNALKDGDCIYRFDTDSGELFELIPEIKPGYYAFAISPDGNQLVYANQTETPVKIKLLDLNNLNEQVLVVAKEDVFEMGSFGWSPSMDQVVFTTLEIVEDEKRVYSIFMLDLKSLKTQVLISDFNEWLELESWDEQRRISYRDTYGAVWELDLERKLLTPLAVPTLTVSP